MSIDTDDAREIARDLRTVAGACAGKAPHLVALIREAADGLGTVSAERDRLADALRAVDAAHAQAAAEVERVKAAWLRAIQAENGCAADGVCINTEKCGCKAELNDLAGGTDNG